PAGRSPTSPRSPAARIRRTRTATPTATTTSTSGGTPSAGTATRSAGGSTNTCCPPGGPPAGEDDRVETSLVGMSTVGEYTADEMMTVAAARALRDGTACFVGIGLPSTAANLARATHAPRLVLIYESGTIGAKPDRLPLSIGDGILADTADAVVSVPEVFNYWLQPGRIDVGFLGAAQLDRYANINTTVLGTAYRIPVVL